MIPDMKLYDSSRGLLVAVKGRKRLLQVSCPIEVNYCHYEWGHLGLTHVDDANYSLLDSLVHMWEISIGGILN